MSGYSANLYAVCCTPIGTASRLFKAGNQLHIASAPVNGSFGHFLAMKLLEDILEATYDCLLRNGITNMKVLILGDNIAMLNAKGKDSKEVSIRKSTAKTNALEALLVTKFKGL